MNVQVIPVRRLPEIQGGAALGALLARACRPVDTDVLVVAQKVVSKAEGRVRKLSEVEPTPKATELATRLGKDPALVQLVLDESRSIVLAERDLLIAETHSGWICANAGVDGSNVPDRDAVTLLPQDPDASARRIRAEIANACGHRPAVVISDSFGRPWRLGQCEVAIGAAGLSPIDDWRGAQDRDGAELAVTAVAVADQMAAAADLARHKASGMPAVILRGIDQRLLTADDGPGAAALQRPPEEDLFR